MANPIYTLPYTAGTLGRFGSDPILLYIIILRLRHTPPAPVHNASHRHIILYYIIIINIIVIVISGVNYPDVGLPSAVVLALRRRRSYFSRVESVFRSRRRNVFIVVHRLIPKS